MLPEFDVAASGRFPSTFAFGPSPELLCDRGKVCWTLTPLEVGDGLFAGAVLREPPCACASWLLADADSLPEPEAWERFPDALARDVESSACVVRPEPFCRFDGLESLLFTVGACRLGAFLEAEAASRGLGSEAVTEPVDDCELCLLGRTGRLFDVVDEATNFLGAGFLSPFAGETELDDARTSGFFLVEGPTLFSLCCDVSSSESGTSTNRAVGLGPEFDGPLGFFKIV